MPVLTRFVATRPRHTITQDDSLAWLAKAHAAAEATARGLDGARRERFASRVELAIAKCACPSEKIARRGHSVDDVARLRTDGELYNLHESPRGAGTAARTRMFEDVVDDYFTQAYADEVAPDDLIHVTCTGYVSPSGAQKLVARRGWGARTRVTHAYHMGCYAALPALRIATGFVATGSARVDLAHTELCSLHLDPSDHALEQLVVQSLFADGLIRYSLVGEGAKAAGLRLLALRERILPDSADAMRWMTSDAGMTMTLARDVPERIAGALRGFVAELFAAAGRDARHVRGAAFAVHPGGPKILDRVRDVLELDDGQLASSRRVLFDYGNMSSATLPHIWARILDDDTLPAGTLVPSLAFGPGLTVCGAILEKRT